MMYFVTSLHTYVPKNRSCAELTKWVNKFNHILIQNEISLDALKEEIHKKIDFLNKKYPKCKQLSFSQRQNSIAVCIPVSGIQTEVFIMNYAKVRSTYSFSEKMPSGNLPEIEKGGKL